MRFVLSRAQLAWLGFMAIVGGVMLQTGVVGATGTGVVTLPSGVDSGLVTTGIALFAAIGAVAVAAVLGVKMLPLATRYVFGWLKMAISRR